MPLPVRRKRGGPLERRLREPPPPFEDEVTLQLAVAREGVGLELSGPIDFGPATLLSTRTRLIGVGFPLDVTGGVERFRHRRTTVESVTLALRHGPSERWLSSISEGLVSRGLAEARVAWVPPPDVGTGEAPWEREEHVVWTSGNVRIELASESAIVAFDLAFAPEGSGVSAIAHRVRAIGTARAPIGIVGSLLGRIARAIGCASRGLRLVIDDPTKPALVQAFVERGARVPVREELAVASLATDPERITLELRRGATPLAPSSLFVALDELDRLVHEGDVALVEGDMDRARELYARALDRAPRHRAILGRLAEVDAFTSDRVEAALSWLRDAQKGRGRRANDGNDLGRTLLTAWLHERAQSRTRARAAWERAGNWAFDRGEPRLAARAWTRAAALCDDRDPLLPSLLDRAVAADPGDVDARWRRARLYIDLHEDARALEDVQHLEAQAKGRELRRKTLMRAASLWHEAGRPDRAIPAWERALRHAPDDRPIVAGLGTALLAAGETTRGVALLSHALELPGDERSRSAIVVELARALAERLGDLPAAIARLREVPVDDVHAAWARALEGACRLQLGDVIGADRAYADAATIVERRGVPPEDAKTVIELLTGGAKVARDEGRASFAMRLSMAALSLAPNDPSARALVQSIGRQVAEQTPDSEPEVEVPQTDPGLGDDTSAHDTAGWSALGILPGWDALGADPDETGGSSDDEARAEAMLARVKADPGDHQAVEALVDLLSRLGRDAELFALIAGRWEDASPDEKKRLLPHQRAVLERLAHSAEARGRSLEARLYRDALAALPRGGG